MDFGVDAPFFLSPISDAEIHAPVLSFGDRHTSVHDRALLLGVDRFHIDELKQLHRVEASLRFLDNAPAIEVALLEGELPLDDAVAHARVAGKLNLAEMRQRSRFRSEDNRGLLAVRAPPRKFT